MDILMKIPQFAYFKQVLFKFERYLIRPLNSL